MMMHLLSWLLSRLMKMELKKKSVVKKHHLNETLVNSLTKSFDGDERLKLRVTNTNAEKAFNLQKNNTFHLTNCINLKYIEMNTFCVQV